MTFWGISFSNISVVAVKPSLSHVLEKCADIPTMHLIFTPCREIQKIRSAHKKRTFQKNIMKAIDIYVLMEICLLVLCAFNTLFYDLWNGEGYFTPRVGFIFMKHLLSHILSAPILSHYIFKHVAISVFSKLFFNMSLSLSFPFKLILYYWITRKV